jgi:hypothetical protein
MRLLVPSVGNFEEGKKSHESIGKRGINANLCGSSVKFTGHAVGFCDYLNLCLYLVSTELCGDVMA